MYHSRFKGTHYEAGLHYGTMMRKNAGKLAGNFGLTQEKVEFAEKCRPVYRECFPEILEEIRGMAEGAQLSEKDLSAFLFCMYGFPYENRCSCFAWKRGDDVLFGRNSDFLVRLEKSNESNYYHLNEGYAFIGNTTAPIEMEDGVNEQGLAVGLTFTYPTVRKTGINAGFLVRYVMEKCRTVANALDHLSRLPISSSQILTMIDPSGEMAVVECNCEHMEILRPAKGEDFILATNQFMSPGMMKYRYHAVDDIHSWERYQTIQTSLQSHEDGSVQFAQDILSGKYGFTCQYERRLGFDTVWSTVCDLKEQKIFRVEGNPSRRRFTEDRRMKLRQ